MRGELERGLPLLDRAIAVNPCRPKWFDAGYVVALPSSRGHERALHELGVAVGALIDSGVAWVLSRLDLQMVRWPRCDDEMVVETWPSAAAARPCCRAASFSVTTTRPRSATSC